MKKQILLIFIALGFIAQVNLNGQTLKHSYTFDDGTANDVVGTLHGTLVGTKISIADGMCTVSGATASTDGYITLDAAALALNTYSAVTLEAYLKTNVTANTSYTMLAYFGNNTGGNKCLWIQPTRGGQTQSRIETNNGSVTRTASWGTEIDDGKYHHVVAVLSATFLRYYVDGVMVSEALLNGDFISTLDNVIAQLFKGPNGWADPNYNASIDKFNIYDGELDAQTIQTNAMGFIGDNRLATLTSDVGALIPTFSANTLGYELIVPTGTTTVNLSATAVDAGATVTISKNGVIDVSSGTSLDTVIVTSTPGGVSKRYTVVVGLADADCYDPSFDDRTNLVDDPRLVSLLSFAGWGNKSINTDLNYVYCGISSGKVNGTNGGSIDVALTSKVKPNRTYQVKAMVYVVASGQFQIGHFGMGIPETTTKTSSVDTWEPINFKFTTGSPLGNNIGMYFNNYNVLGDVGYIDNWELYLLNNNDTLSDLTVDGTTVSGFAPDDTSYNVELDAGTTVVPTVAATAADAGATVVITPASSLPGTTAVLVTAEDSTQLTYKINFSVGTNIKNTKNSLVNVMPKVSNDNFKVEFAGNKLGMILVYDIGGREISRKVANNATEIVSIPKAGVYIIKVKIDKAIETFKVVKLK